MLGFAAGNARERLGGLREGACGNAAECPTFTMRAFPHSMRKKNRPGGCRSDSLI